MRNKKLYVVYSTGSNKAKVKCKDCNQVFTLASVAEITDSKDTTIAFLCMECVKKHW